MCVCSSSSSGGSWDLLSLKLKLTATFYSRESCGSVHLMKRTVIAMSWITALQSMVRWLLDGINREKGEIVV